MLRGFKILLLFHLAKLSAHKTIIYRSVLFYEEQDIINEKIIFLIRFTRGYESRTKNVYVTFCVRKIIFN